MTLFPGDPAPSFRAVANNNPDFAFDMAGGRNIVLTFLGADTPDPAFLKTMAAPALYDDDRTALFFVTPHSVEAAPPLPLRSPGIRAFYDADQTIAKLYGLETYPVRPVSFILSPRLQVLAIIHTEPARHLESLLEILGRVPPPSALPPILTHAPILIVPHIFEPKLCQHLIAGYKRDGGKPSGFMRDVDGRTREMQDAAHKVRRDWVIEDETLIQALQGRILRRLVPEIQRAFQFKATRMERYLVACYGAGEGGHFRPHRDNTTKGTAHRRFAVSINLNPDEYEGGDLCFPEFGTQNYRPPLGGCVVFSCSLMHEARPVTRGERYAFLPFLYDEAARKVRDENLAYVEKQALAG